MPSFTANPHLSSCAAHCLATTNSNSAFLCYGFNLFCFLLVFSSYINLCVHYLTAHSTPNNWAIMLSAATCVFGGSLQLSELDAVTALVHHRQLNEEICCQGCLCAAKYAMTVVYVCLCICVHAYLRIAQHLTVYLLVLTAVSSVSWTS